MFISAYSKRGLHSWGFIDFEDIDHDLEARLLCNGKQSYPVGVSVCQSLNGLLQQISFPGEVNYAFSEECKMKTKDNIVFDFEMTNGECVFLFRSKQNKKLHRLTTLGYQEILIRGE